MLAYPKLEAWANVNFDERDLNTAASSLANIWYMLTDTIPPEIFQISHTMWAWPTDVIYTHIQLDDSKHCDVTKRWKHVKTAPSLITTFTYQWRLLCHLHILIRQYPKQRWPQKNKHKIVTINMKCMSALQLTIYDIVFSHVQVQVI
jgi:hypothetical protein